jgi:XTP/dITP diphosphohydrolase
VLFTAEGVVEGEIWPEPRGSHGFGYDPVFFYPPYGATFGEVDDARKLEVAHRGRAFRLVRDWLRPLLPFHGEAV